VLMGFAQWWSEENLCSDGSSWSWVHMALESPCPRIRECFRVQLGFWVLLQSKLLLLHSICCKAHSRM
jgi:hypothetical protein